MRLQRYLLRTSESVPIDPITVPSLVSFNTIAAACGLVGYPNTNPLSRRIVVKVLQCFLYLGVFHLEASENLFDAIQTLYILGHINGATLVLMRAEVLDLLAAVFDLCQS